MKLDDRDPRLELLFFVLLRNIAILSRQTDIKYISMLLYSNESTSDFQSTFCSEDYRVGCSRLRWTLLY